jgi:hypothetical protein
MPIITVTLTEAEAIGLGQLVYMADTDEAAACWMEVWPEKPVIDKEAAAEAVRSAKAKVLEALEAADRPLRWSTEGVLGSYL